MVYGNVEESTYQDYRVRTPYEEDEPFTYDERHYINVERRPRRRKLDTENTFY